MLSGAEVEVKTDCFGNIRPWPQPLSQGHYCKVEAPTSRQLYPDTVSCRRGNVEEGRAYRSIWTPIISSMKFSMWYFSHRVSTPHHIVIQVTAATAYIQGCRFSMYLSCLDQKPTRSSSMNSSLSIQGRSWGWTAVGHRRESHFNTKHTCLCERKSPCRQKKGNAIPLLG